MTVAVFGGPWDTGHRSQDGAIMGFADVEHALKAALTGDPRFNVVELDIAVFVAANPRPQLEGIDIVYANCGPLAALLFHWREKYRLRFAIIREVRTLGWIGYAFQEYMASRLERPGIDFCVHTSRYSQALWHALRPASRDRFFYPLLRAPRSRILRQPDAGAGLRCGVFSRISEDKGFCHVPAILERLLAAGWPVRELVICGAVDERALLERCRRATVGLGIALDYRDELGHREALRQIASVDAVLCPTVSSFEALGRVVLEAYQLGKPVIASDYCAGHEVLRPDHRIPLELASVASGTGSRAFPVARLAVEAWTAPSWAADGFIEEGCARFRYRDEDVRELLGARDDGPQPPYPDAAPRMVWHWEEIARHSPDAWCEKVGHALAATCRDRRDLLDLGGAFKRGVLAAGFDPRVSFYRTASSSERKSSNLPDALRGIASQ